ncbi:MAG: hypothetical protein AB1772_00120 [Candidatus Zixiibacteriota bacterium]
MYNIEKTHWGYRLTFGGATDVNELTAWLEESRRILSNQEDEFYVFVDMRTLIPLDKEAQVPMYEGQKLYRAKGMVRSVVILSSPVVAAQFRRIGGETGIGKWERYIDASTVADWEERGLNWLFNEIDPETAANANNSSRIKIAR